MPFHKSCYTTRSSGYKYRTLSTNTGETKRVQKPAVIPPPEINPIDMKFHQLHDNISLLISKELDETSRSRSMIFDKFEKINAKIDAMLDLQNNVLAMRETLNSATGTLEELYEKIQKIEVMTELNSIKCRKNSNRIRSGMVGEEADIAEQEIYCSEMTEQPSVIAV